MQDDVEAVGGELVGELAAYATACAGDEGPGWLSICLVEIALESGGSCVQPD